MRTTSPVNRLLIFMAIVSLLGYGAATRRCQIADASSQDVPTDTVITLERTECFGTCPDYKITISADGNVIFDGRRFVKKVGKAKSTVSQEQLREIIAAFEDINYFELRDKYEGPGDGCKQLVTDHPSAITSIRIDGKSKTVRHYYGCWGVEVLAELKKLEEGIDKTVNSAQWIR